MSAKTQNLGVSSLLSNLFNRKREARRKGKALASGGRRIRTIEGLEKREMFAVTSLNLLPINPSPYIPAQYSVIIGTDNNSTSVSVSQSGSLLTVNDNTTGRHWDFAASMIKRVDFYGGAGADRFVNYISTMPVWAYGQGGNDYLEGYSAADILDGGADNDTLIGFGGDDILRGGNGNDFIQGMSGYDSLYGDAGEDYLDGGSENDYIYGGDNNDTLLGGPGDDQLIAEGGNDQLNGQAGNDSMWGGIGNDVLIAIDGAFNDYLEGGTDNDVLWIDRTYNLSGGKSDRTAGVTSADTLQQVEVFANGADLTLDFDNIADPVDIGVKKTFTNTITADKIRGTNPLFSASGPTSSDIRQQGPLGDCWMLAGLGAIADKSPNLIRQNVVDFNDGTYGVRLGDRFYRVDNELAVKSSASAAVGQNLTRAGLGAEESMWVAVIEKAFTHFQSTANTYASLNSGYPKTAYQAFRMTEVGGTYLKSIYGSATAMANDFYNRWLNGFSMSIGIISNPSKNSWHGLNIVGFARNASGAISGIMLRNPWGIDGIDQVSGLNGASAGSSPDDGIITVSISQLFASGAYVQWARA